MTSSISSVFDCAIREHVSVIEQLRAEQPVLERIAAEMVRAVSGSNKIMWCGNGGSAADAQHLAAELVGRFRRERMGLASIALTTDTSVLTSIGNDYGFEHIFSRQVEAVCNEGDVFVGISTSGRSQNICLGLEKARDKGAFTVAFTGEGESPLAAIAHLTVCVPSRDTARVQEAHILCGHMLCDWIEICVCENKMATREITAQ